MSILHTYIPSRVIDDNGLADGATLTFYLSGTNTLAPVYADAALTTPLTNPVVVPSGAEVPTIYLDDAIDYRRVVTYSDGSTEDIDPYEEPFGQEARQVRADLASTDSGKGADLVGYGTRTVSDKLGEIVSIRDFGAVGDGVTDDTAAIQAALNSGAKTITFPAGVYITGPLTLAQDGVTIIATGATIKLKSSAATLGLLTVTGDDCTVNGGTWDGNKAGSNIGTWGTAQFNSFAIFMQADRCTVKNATIEDFWGIGIKGLGSYLSAIKNRISGTQAYGVFFDGATGVSYTGNKASGNTIDMSQGQVVASANQGQGILFTAVSGQSQLDWEVSNNTINGPQTSVTDQAINIAVRGDDGICSNNTTRHGGMGFSEGGDNCVVTGNRFLALKGTFRVGIEPSGRFTASGNTVTDAYVGIDCTSTTASYDESVVSGNTIRTASGGSVEIGVRLLIDAAQTGRNVVISGNSIATGGKAIVAARDCAGLMVAGNTFKGPGVSSGRGVQLDNPPAAAFVTITGNLFRDFVTPHSVTNASAVTHTDLYASANNYINCGSNRRTWLGEGSATIGARCCVLGVDFGTRDVYDVASNIFVLRSTSYNNPDGLLTAGIGSIHYSLNSGGGTYYKKTGTGNTGWVLMA